MTGLHILCTWLACAAGADAASEADFKAIHARVYGVYEMTGAGAPDRDALHGLLAGSFAGDALTREYVEHWTSLVSLRDLGATVRVDAVSYEDVAVVGAVPGGVEIEASWTVTGQIQHGAHAHVRVNRYEAVYTVTQTGAGPRITSTRLKNLRRLPGAPPPDLQLDGAAAPPDLDLQIP